MTCLMTMMLLMMTMTPVGDEDDQANRNAELSLQSNAMQIFVSVAAPSDLYDFCLVMLLQISPKRQRQNSIHTKLAFQVSIEGSNQIKTEIWVSPEIPL